MKTTCDNLAYKFQYCQPKEELNRTMPLVILLLTPIPDLRYMYLKQGHPTVNEALSCLFVNTLSLMKIQF